MTPGSPLNDEMYVLERELGTYLQSTLDIALRLKTLPIANARSIALVVTKLEEAQMWNERR